MNALAAVLPRAVTAPDAALAEMAGQSCDVRFVFLMRDPVARLVSGVRHHLRDTGAEVAAAVAVQAGVVAALDRPEGPGMRRSRNDVTLRALEARRAGVLRHPRALRRAGGGRPAVRLAGHRAAADRYGPAGTPRGGAGIGLPTVLQARARAALVPACALVEQRFGELPPGWAPPPAEE